MCIKNLLAVSMVFGISVYADGVNMNNHSFGNTNGGNMIQGNGQMFEQHKLMLIQMHQQRLQIIQNGYNCISSATNHDALRSCEMMEKQSLEDVKNQFKQQRESIKQRGSTVSINGIRPNQQESIGQGSN